MIHREVASTYAASRQLPPLTASLVRVMTILSAIAFIASCGSKAPLYVDDVPSTSNFQMPSVPRPELTPIEIRYPRTSTDVASDDYVKVPTHDINPSSSVVISIPQDEIERIRNEQFRKELASKNDQDIREDMKEQIEISQGNNNQYRSEGYYHYAEQQIERSLMGLGLRIRDRSKFEAKLRDVRNNNIDFAANRVLMERELENLNERKQDGKITDDEHNKLIGDIRNKYGFSSIGSAVDDVITPYGLGSARGKLTKEELVDNAELLRAAQSDGDDGVNADYVLQINNFQVVPSSNRRIPLNERTEVKRYLESNPNAYNVIPKDLTVPFFIGELNAKLISVETGDIIWIGEHQVDTLGAEDDGIVVNLEVLKTVNNESAIREKIETYNSTTQSLAGTARKLRTELDLAYNEYGIDIYGPLKSKYEAALSRLRQHTSTVPVSSSPWTYDYNVKMRVTPDFTRNDTIMEKEARARHHRNITKRVATELIKTIAVSSQSGK